MEELREQLSVFLSDRLYQIIISNPRKKEGAFKIKIRPVMVKGALCFQETISKGTQVFHENHKKDELILKIISYMTSDFKQLEAESMDGKLHVLVSKKGRMMVKRKGNSQEGLLQRPDMSHNRAKKYILEEGKAVPFLVDLGIQTKEGRIVHAKYDKYRQINRYLEFVEDIVPAFLEKERVYIIDFGCGKSYLTFALYYYLHELKGLDVYITGLDLKADVMKRCGELAIKYGYENLHFYQGDISTFEGVEQVDMVVTLHACDTATDYAIKKAVDWQARVIFTVPCCQHEVNKQIESAVLKPVLRYGILKERIAALLTDGIRANLLEEAGYDTQVLEFIDMEHTPKNILIRAVKRQGEGENMKKNTKVEDMTRELHIETTLQKLMVK
ncbi:class I SAM-dependent methyltransferase [Parablautia muri]|uniref:SAM-dependent methyltransferase n=1 Tax=Parablautia muri TaxID=2320879 RepID=A0A9X5BGR2_9FIRM|nr:SAM-dependent methyltransferase [Parablautia muri]